jgi:hypothetical protein
MRECKCLKRVSDACLKITHNGADSLSDTCQTGCYFYAQKQYLQVSG